MYSISISFVCLYSFVTGALQCQSTKILEFSIFKRFYVNVLCLQFASICSHLVEIRRLSLKPRFPLFEWKVENMQLFTFQVIIIIYNFSFLLYVTMKISNRLIGVRDKSHILIHWMIYLQSSITRNWLTEFVKYLT